MSKSYTMNLAVKKAITEMSFSSQKMGSCEVVAGPLVTAYEDPNGRTRLDIIDHGLVSDNLTEAQALEYADAFFD